MANLFNMSMSIEANMLMMTTTMKVVVVVVYLTISKHSSFFSKDR